MTAVMRRTWTAQYETDCATCPGRIFPGDLIFFASPGGTEGSSGPQPASGVDCCGARDVEVLSADSEDEASLTVDAGQVMPRGRTARDACPTCWQVPASSGACGCDA